jgi:hypothetical protein
MEEFIERPFELRCPNCMKWTNIHCTDEELFPKSLNSICPHCTEVLNYYVPSIPDNNGDIVMKIAHSIVYRTTIVL